MDAIKQKTQNILQSNGSLKPTQVKDELIDGHDSTNPLSTENDIQDGSIVTDSGDSLNNVTGENCKEMQAMEASEFCAAVYQSKDIEEPSLHSDSSEKIKSDKHHKEQEDFHATGTSSCVEKALDVRKLTSAETSSKSNDDLLQDQSKWTRDGICVNSKSKNVSHPQEDTNDSSAAGNESLQTTPFSTLHEIPSEDSLDSIIPRKIQAGFRNVQVSITSVDSSGVFILCGTDAGCGFLYNRETGNLMKLACEVRIYNSLIKKYHTSCMLHRLQPTGRVHFVNCDVFYVTLKRLVTSQTPNGVTDIICDMSIRPITVITDHY